MYGHWTSFQLSAVEREEQADPFSRGGSVDCGQQNPSEAGVQACFLGEALGAAPGQAQTLTQHWGMQMARAQDGQVTLGGAACHSPLGATPSACLQV